MSKKIGRFFVPVEKDKLRHNHAEKLKFWLDEDRFELFRNYISVDHYLAIEKNGRQFYLFAMCRESGSENYDNKKYPYYLATEEARAIVDYARSLS